MTVTGELSNEAREWVDFVAEGLKNRRGRLSPQQFAQYISLAFEREFPSKTASDKMARALARGVSVREKLLTEEGGSISADETARLLRLSKQSVLNQYRSGKLLGFRTEKQSAVRFPVWQFVNGERLPGLADVLSRLQESGMLDDLGKIGFFLQSHRLSEGRRPLDLLRQGKQREVMNIVDGYLE